MLFRWFLTRIASRLCTRDYSFAAEFAAGPDPDCPSARISAIRHGVRSDRERNAAYHRRGPADAAAVGDPRSGRTHRHEIQLRHRAMRCVHAARRWTAGPILQRPRGHGHRQAGHDDRGPLARRQPSHSDRLEGARRSTVRLLPVRHDHEHARPAARAPEPHRRRHRRPDHQRLPLQHLPPRSPGDSPGR